VIAYFDATPSALGRGQIKMNKKPWLGVVLNFASRRVGYIYVGKRILFGILVLIIEIGSIIYCAIAYVSV